MKKAVKLFSSFIVGTFAFVLAISAPGTGSVEAYVSYNNTKSNTANYSSYKSYSSYNNNKYTNASPSSNYTKYNYGSGSNYNRYNYNTNYNYYNRPSTNQNTQTNNNQPTYKPGTTGQTSTGVVVSDEQAMLNLINKERAAAGLQPLAADAKLTQIARMKAQDMIDNNYFSHTSPTYGSPFDMMKNNGVVYHYAGENLAGAPDVNTAHANLMNSPGHKANILKPEYTKVGIGVVSGGNYGKMFVQEFNG